MKKLIIALCLGAVSSVSMAATVCAGGVASAVASDAPAPAARTKFVFTGFTPRCSANTQVDFQEDASSAAVGSTSFKGNQSFGGHSNGGAVVKYSDAPTGYTDAATALTAAVAAATAKLAEASSS